MPSPSRLLTCVVMLITTPLTLKGTRSMIEMQRLQPQIRAHAGPVQGRSPEAQRGADGVLPRARDQPGGRLPATHHPDAVFSILFYVVRGLTNEASFVGVQKLLKADYFPSAVVTQGFKPKYLHTTPSCTSRCWARPR
jgi:hypothetical protein